MIGGVALPGPIESMFLFPALQLPDKAWIGVDLGKEEGTLLRLRWTALKASW